MSKKNITALVVTVVVILFIALSLKMALAIMVGSVILCAAFAIICEIAVKTEEEVRRIEKENPELGKKIRLQMMEEELRRRQMIMNI